ANCANPFTGQCPCERISCLNQVFFFQAEDGIRYSSVTGVQTCALPIFKLKLTERYAKDCLLSPALPACHVTCMYVTAWVMGSLSLATGSPVFPPFSRFLGQSTGTVGPGTHATCPNSGASVTYLESTVAI